MPSGSCPIKQLQVGDVVLARSEHDPDGAVEAKVVEQVFVRTGRVLHVHVGGQVIGTTAEHPFFAHGRGWVPAGQLRPGDILSTSDGQGVAVEELFDTGEEATVYNLSVAEHHTYFVGCPEWGFAAWAHNIYYQVDPTLQVVKDLKNVLDNARGGNPLKGMPLAASINLANQNFKSWSDLDGYLAANKLDKLVAENYKGTITQKPGLLYVLVNRKIDTKDAVLKVGITTEWKKRIGEYRGWALNDQYWRTGNLNGGQLVLYIFAVTKAMTKANLQGIEISVRKALHDAQYKLLRDYQAPAEWMRLNGAQNTGGMSSTQNTSSNLNISAVIAGPNATTNPGLTGFDPMNEPNQNYYTRLDLNWTGYAQQIADKTKFPQEATGYVYIIEDRDAKTDTVRILKVGIVVSETPAERFAEYELWAKYRQHITIHLFRLSEMQQRLPAQYQGDNKAGAIESAIREQLLTSGKYKLPEDLINRPDEEMNTERANRLKFPKPFFIAGLDRIVRRIDHNYET